MEGCTTSSFIASKLFAKLPSYDLVTYLVPFIEVTLSVRMVRLLRYLYSLVLSYLVLALLSIGFSGETCMTNIDDCIGKSCGNGKCIDGVAKAFCECPIGKIGSACNKGIANNLGSMLSY